MKEFGLQRLPMQAALLLLVLVRTNLGLIKSEKSKQPWRKDGDGGEKGPGQGGGGHYTHWRETTITTEASAHAPTQSPSPSPSQPPEVASAAAWLDPQATQATEGDRLWTTQSSTPSSSFPPPPSPPHPTPFQPAPPPNSFSSDLQFSQKLWQQQQEMWQQHFLQQQSLEREQGLCTSQKEVCLPSNYSRFQLPNKGKHTIVSIGELRVLRE